MSTTYHSYLGLLSLLVVASAHRCSTGHRLGLIVEIAQQLLTDGWEFDSLQESSGWLCLHFVELKKEAWALSLGLDVDTSREGNGLWLLMDEDFAFDLLFESDY